VEFRLLYEGPLLASANDKPRPKEKHSIRRILHPQLRRQWQMNQSLRQLATHLGNMYDPIPIETEEAMFQHGISALAKQRQTFGYEFIPLVTSEHAVRCCIDILLLRPEENRFIFTQGDIDGQVKTIFDALALPKSLVQAGSTGPTDDETPFFCLLEDDRLISEVYVNADQLLLLPNSRAVQANDAFVIIHVTLNARNPGAMGNFLA
jgi:hypothetical protein